ncbi:PREDICTED: prostatic acid phosphatase-like isoform X2 [Ceratosolen solmsi marchali]|uniref:acid phosphatase n=1 Tax=Ceratosolen solmsi marchali TaxID=326594 RepID=A0AAJ7E0S1_9HYME|nr:PREDICTED: prostatic acid phosphatase-like isoform X2 [Ceratosolen solmsi marchali]
MWKILGILLFNLAGFYSYEEDLGRIIFTNILFRHGDRTPIKAYPNDPYRNESSWPVPFGQLTNLGKHQHLLLGQWFRNRYDHLLPKTYSFYDIYIMSTDVDRTLMSAEANLAGLYPPSGDQVWDIKMWMPIPVHTIPEHEDNLLAVKKYCDKYDYELQKVLNSPEIKNLDKINFELYQYLTKMSGKTVFSLQSVEYLYNILFIEELNNKSLPKWTKSIYPDKLKPLAEKSFTISAYNKILQRLKSGPLLKNMIEHMKLKSKHILMPDRKLWIYSAHDETIANMLMTLNLFDPHCPPYTATLLLELRINTKNEHIFYKNSSKEPTLLTLPGCTAACSLNQFILLTKDVIPVNWERECLMNNEIYSFNISATTIIVMLTTSILMLILLVLMIITFMYGYHRRQHNQNYSRLSMDGA